MPKRKQGDGDDGWGPRESLPMRNADWEIYYSTTLNLTSEEFAEMKKSFLEPLPVGVRINPLFPVDIKTRLLNFDPVPSVLPYLPGSLEFSSIDRRAVKKSGDLKSLKKLLHSAEVVGAITRQEVVSMIPPLALSVRSDTAQQPLRVLDMCAAPGSKTTQIAEALILNAETVSPVTASGILVGNDVDWKRANMLAHQTARLCHTGTLITNCDAYFFPVNPTGGYDRVLCDVPCTSDGTLRKSPEIWGKWRIQDGFSIHPRQLQILLKGLSLTKDLLVYSTCSLNVLENEAVVAAALGQIEGEFELVDWAHEASGLVAKEGMDQWKVLDPNTKAELRKEDFKGDLSRSRVKQTMFPPDTQTVKDQLKRSRRFLPHLMNTGGFYVAVFRRIKGEAKTKQFEKKARHIQDIDPGVFKQLQDFYGLAEELRECLVVPREAETRIALVSTDLKELLINTDPSLKVVSVGVRAFQTVNTSTVTYRLTQEGARVLWKQMKKRVVHVELELFSDLVTKREVSTEKFEGCVGWESLADEYGPVVIVCRDIPLACMAFARSVQVFADKQYTEALAGML